LAVTTPTAFVLVTGGLVRFEAGDIALFFLDTSNHFDLVHRVGTDIHLICPCSDFIHVHMCNLSCLIKRKTVLVTQFSWQRTPNGPERLSQYNFEGVSKRYRRSSRKILMFKQYNY